MRAEPELLPTAVEELLRFHSPVTVGRKVTEPVSVGGVEMRPGDKVLLNFPGANRDPAAFDRPDEVVLDRKRNRHLAFGLGIHRCAGSNLARMEMQVCAPGVVRSDCAVRTFEPRWRHLGRRPGARPPYRTGPFYRCEAKRLTRISRRIQAKTCCSAWPESLSAIAGSPSRAIPGYPTRRQARTSFAPFDHRDLLFLRAATEAAIQDDGRTLFPRDGRARGAGVLGREPRLRGSGRPLPREVLLPVDVPVSEREVAHGARAQLHHRRRDQPVPAHVRTQTSSSPWDGTRSVSRRRTRRCRTACLPRAGPTRTSST